MIYFTADIYDELSSSVDGLGLSTECLGGGRIAHQPEVKKIKVYGYSQVGAQITSCLVFMVDFFAERLNINLIEYLKKLTLHLSIIELIKSLRYIFLFRLMKY